MGSKHKSGWILIIITQTRRYYCVPLESICGVCHTHHHKHHTDLCTMVSSWDGCKWRLLIRWRKIVGLLVKCVLVSCFCGNQLEDLQLGFWNCGFQYQILELEHFQSFELFSVNFTFKRNGSETLVFQRFAWKISCSP